MTARVDRRNGARRRPRQRSRLRYWVGDPLEAVPVYLLIGLSWLLPTPAASAIGGWLGRTIGSRLPSQRRRILAHLALAMPELDEAERLRILRATMDHVGRVVMETPHIKRIARKRIEIRDFDPVRRELEAGRAVFCLSGHTGNWEVGPTRLLQAGFATAAFYRRPNNRFVDALLKELRVAGTASLVLLAKGDDITHALRRTIREGRLILGLLDQRFSEGTALPFFGRPALTNTLIAEMALRFDVPLCFGRAVRLEGARFRFDVVGPIAVERTDDIKADARALMIRYNEQLEAWIREHPAQWLWSHRRWRL